MDHAPNSPAAPLKVMILALEYTPEESGGVGTHAFELAHGLSAAGCRVTVLAYTSREPATQHEPNLTVHLLAPGSARAAQLSIAQGILSFNDDLAARARTLIDADGPPDIVQFYNWITFPAAQRLREALGIPIIGVIQYVSEPIERWWGQTPDAEIAAQEAALFRDSGPLICCSGSLRTIIQGAYGVPAERLRVVHNGMNMRAFAEAPSAPGQLAQLRRTIAREGEQIVLFAGRLHPQKGVGALIESAARVIAQRPQVRYLLAGAPDSQQFTQSVRALLERHADAQPRIKLLGKLPRRQLSWLYQVADLAVAPSVYEPFGYAAIEAMAAGVPLVATEVGGLAEIVEDGRTGLLVPVHTEAGAPHAVDVERLAAAQLALLSDAGLARRLGEAGRRRVFAAFDLDTMTQAFLDAYREAITLAVG